MFSEKRIAIALLIALFALQAYVLVERSDRQPHIDEVEYLHAGWMMANGGKIFRTFFEHHSPILFAAIAPLAPHAERVDVQPYAEHARWLAGFFGLIALACVAALVWRISPIAAPLAIAIMFVLTDTIWLRVIADVRAEPFALGFFWLGVALVFLPKRHASVFAGIGVGLIAIAGLWTPKWPLVSAAIGIWALIRARRMKNMLIVSAIAATFAAIGVAIVNAIAPLELVRLYVLDFNAIGNRIVQESPTTYRLARPFFNDLPTYLALPAILIASLIVIAAMVIDRERRQPLLFLVIAVAAGIELRYFQPYPTIWQHNYGLWCLAGAAILASTPRAILTLLDRAHVTGPLRRYAPALLAAAALLVLLPSLVVQLSFVRDDTGLFFRSQRAFVARLRPNETVWMGAKRHPISVRDASFYWFGYDGTIGYTNEHLARTERGARLMPPLGDPFCNALRGATTLRFADPEGVPATEKACYAELVRDGRVRPSMLPRVYEILPPHR